MPTYRFTCAYNGNNYYGWQIQPDVTTVQGVLEGQFKQLFETPITVYGSGRTDRGVHAFGQVAHVDLPEPLSKIIPQHRWEAVINQRLPEDIRVSEIEAVDESFHARHSATWRVYGYRFDLSRNSPFLASTGWPVSVRQLNLRAVRELLPLLDNGIPTRLFSGKGGSTHEAETWEITCRLKMKSQRELWFLVGAKSYRYKMVRCLARAVHAVLTGQWALKKMEEKLNNQRRALNPAPPSGCYLLDVFYQPVRKSLFLSKAWQRVLNAT